MFTIDIITNHILHKLRLVTFYNYAHRWIIVNSKNSASTVIISSNDFSDRHVDYGRQDGFRNRGRFVVRSGGIPFPDDKDPKLIRNAEIRDALDQGLEGVLQSGHEHRDSDQVFSDPERKEIRSKQWNESWSGDDVIKLFWRKSRFPPI